MDSAGSTLQHSPLSQTKLHSSWSIINNLKIICKNSGSFSSPPSPSCWGPPPTPLFPLLPPDSFHPSLLPPVFPLTPISRFAFTYLTNYKNNWGEGWNCVEKVSEIHLTGKAKERFLGERFQIIEENDNLGRISIIIGFMPQ